MFREHLPNEQDSGFGSIGASSLGCQQWPHRNHIQMALISQRHGSANIINSNWAQTRRKTENRARRSLIPLYTLIRQRKVYKIRGELSSENTVCSRGCSNASVELSEKMRLSAGKSHLNFYFISKGPPAFTSVCCCVFTMPPFREAVGLA